MRCLSVVITSVVLLPGTGKGPTCASPLQTLAKSGIISPVVTPCLSEANENMVNLRRNNHSEYSAVSLPPVPSVPPSVAEPTIASEYIQRDVLPSFSRPATGAAHALADLPVLRDLVSNKAGRGTFSTKKANNIPATIVQCVGDEAPAPCNRCAQRFGLWAQCVVPPVAFHGVTKGACATCHFESLGSRCSLHKKNRVPMAPAPPAVNTLPGSTGLDLAQLKEDSKRMTDAQRASAEARIQAEMAALGWAKLELQQREQQPWSWEDKEDTEFGANFSKRTWHDSNGETILYFRKA
ncbi:hypothetical protein SODALDRAFT_329037 [Sodiomyces alkalinus F11]|uniref:Uncharacterized protein n=1 Tax=Sodiomyces alkalinus (strain CBS 110278 / VKM F-3762 / F11) TaxID=1314773 RepID=A0A3N2PML6_SODAK|nr:hypothetical protein SODALDRAFT_329037 [Sodiomyces alkalinus F11]ROT35670.1 hypothetical protein SODALDRAFT_329037 [Sodiomyces alkalinus F11]